MKDSELLTTKDVAELLGKSKETIHQLVFKKLIPHYKPNARTLYFLKQEIIEWATKNRVPAV